jgi:putative DNA primase/helicase
MIHAITSNKKKRFFLMPEIEKYLTSPLYLAKAKGIIKDNCRPYDSELAEIISHMLLKEFRQKDIMALLQEDNYKELLKESIHTTPERQYPPEIADLFDGKIFLHEKAAKRILERQPLFTNEGSRDIYAYKEGYYSRKGDGKVSDEVCELLGQEAIPMRVQQVLIHIKHLTLKEKKEIDNRPDLLNVNNGLLNLQTRTLSPHTPDIIMLNKLPVNYDANATCPLWDAFLNEFIPETENRLGLQEFFGYCLQRSQSFQKAFMLYGSGGEGKTQMLEILQHMLGEEAVANVELQKLDTDPYAPARLEGMLANIFMDIGKGGLDECHIFKQAVEGSPIDCQNKFKDMFKMRAYAKMIFSTNTIPEMKEDTDAIYRRWIVMKFSKKVEEKRKIADYYKVFLPELPGILNWALDGLDRLLKQNKFSNDIGTDETRKLWSILANPVRVYVEDNVIAMPDGYIKKRELFNKLHEFCKEKKLKMPSDKKVTMTLQETFPYVESARIRINDGINGKSPEGYDRVWVYRGITWFKEDSELREFIQEGKVQIEIKQPESKIEQKRIKEDYEIDFLGP